MARAPAMALRMIVFAMSVALSRASTSVPAPPPKVDCSTVVFGMVDCMDYVTAGSNVTKPSDSCCHGLVAVVSYSPSCLCDGLEEAAKMGIPVDLKRAAGLPDACSVKVPPVGVCDAGESPSPSPSPSARGPPAPASSPKVPSPPPLPSPSSPPPSPSKPPSLPYLPAPSPSDKMSAGWASKSSIFILSISLGVAVCSLLSH